MQSSHLLVLFIVLIACGWSLFDSYLKRRRKDRRAAASDEDAQAMLARIDELEERIRVIEKIVTDPKDRLARAIDDL